ncbi:M23 family metallopeptidase [Aliarcobacter skirrowii]|uniref:M23 family metallopeptidase n=1 Tax=Aliarcobacter skirrowii TaxID=28200 RepID=UPI0029B96822|nr:M23 family metallopeptidase [Aliarcobacter skirrowii]MDX4047868.1 M23 family metallopeptidase [Aliarcobacter skirrowii]MDX4061190.1 M23 family metallopeptidase [Aliarcobacter skirrowii]
MRKKGYSNIIIIVVLLAIVGLGSYIFLLGKSKPEIYFQLETNEEKIYWNLRKELAVDIVSKRKIANFKAVLKDGENLIELDSKILKEDLDSQVHTYLIFPPKTNNLNSSSNLILEVTAMDDNKINHLLKEESTKSVDIVIDRTYPKVEVLSNSYSIKQGGSAVVVAKIEDINLKDYYVTFNDDVIFELFPFEKEGYFVSIVTWPIDLKEFKGFNIVSMDKAGNKTIQRVPYYIQSYEPKIDKLKISDSFIYSVSKNVLEMSNLQVPNSAEEIFIKTNKELRENNLKTIRNVVIENFNQEPVLFDIKPFLRMKGAKTFARFGERRHYYYNDVKIDEAWHLGIDWASVKHANVYTSNSGRVIFKDYLGIYGESIIIDHGLGLSSLYAHTSSQKVEVGDMVEAGTYIANTGSTGAVFGDHLHFGILIQGIEANPSEWLDAKWIDENIVNIIYNAKDIIKGIE